MTYNEFLNHVKKRTFENAYFFYGSEDYLMDDCTKRLIDAVVEPETKDFNLDIFYGSQVEDGQVIEAANAYPMLAESRVVVLKQLHKLSSGSMEALLTYLEKPAPTTKLLLISNQMNNRGKNVSKLKSRCCSIEFKPLYDNKVPRWITDYVTTRGYEIDTQAALLMHAHVGSNLRSIVNELDKIFLNLTDSRKIVEADVQNVVGVSRKFSVFNLNDAIGNKDIEKSLLILNKMLEGGESHTAILAMVSRHFENLLKVKGAVSTGKGQNEISTLTGIPPFFVDKTKQMAKKYSLGEFDKIFDNLLATDLVLKTSRQSPKLALQTMLLRILR